MTIRFAGLWMALAWLAGCDKQEPPIDLGTMYGHTSAAEVAQVAPMLGKELVPLVEDSPWGTHGSRCLDARDAAQGADQLKGALQKKGWQSELEQMDEGRFDFHGEKGALSIAGSVLTDASPDCHLALTFSVRALAKAGAR